MKIHVEQNEFDVVSWREGYALPKRFTATLDDATLPYVVDLAVKASTEGVECRSVTFGARDTGEPISARALRAIPIAVCIRLATAAAAMKIERLRDGGAKLSPPAGLETPFVLARPVDKRMSDAHLREVARVYEDADMNPTRAVELHWEAMRQPISYPTAARWVSEARKRGFLKPVVRK